MSTGWRQLGAVQRRVLLRLHGERPTGGLGEHVETSVEGLVRRGLVTVVGTSPDIPLVGLHRVVWSRSTWLLLSLTEDGEAAVAEGLLRGLRG